MKLTRTILNTEQCILHEFLSMCIELLPCIAQRNIHVFVVSFPDRPEVEEFVIPHPYVSDVEV